MVDTIGKSHRHAVGRHYAVAPLYASAWRRAAGLVTVPSDPDRLPPILADKDYAAASVFTPSNLLREARRQKGLAAVSVPEICVLDPDGDILRRLRRSGHAQRLRSWACYHTELFAFDHEGEGFGIIGCAVGAAFAVLLAEQLFACGCQFLVSVTSAGQILEQGETPYFVLIDRALRDEGTSYHYLPPSEFAAADSRSRLPR